MDERQAERLLQLLENLLLKLGEETEALRSVNRSLCLVLGIDELKTGQFDLRSTLSLGEPSKPQ